MKIPQSNRKKALIVVDVQPGFMNERNKYIIDNIAKLLDTVKYDLYLHAIFHAEKGSLWDLQQNWTLPKNQDTHVVDELRDKLSSLNSIYLEKETKSVFKADKSAFDLLKQNQIKEVHFVGVDTNDCVLASAYESFDLGFITYVIEECCQSSSSDKLHQSAIEFLRHQNMTNNSNIADR